MEPLSEFRLEHAGRRYRVELRVYVTSGTAGSRAPEWVITWEGTRVGSIALADASVSRSALESELIAVIDAKEAESGSER